jgi:glycerophosphoryl diester phosphodiesterase
MKIRLVAADLFHVDAQRDIYVFRKLTVAMVNVWTVDDPEAVKLMLKCGVDGIITNKPDAAIACRDAYKGEIENAGK